MAQLAFKIAAMQECSEQMFEIADYLNDKQREITFFARSFDSSQRSIKALRDIVYRIEIGRSSNRFCALAGGIREFCDLYNNNEQVVRNILNNHSDESKQELKVIEENISTAVDGYESFSDFYALLKIITAEQGNKRFQNIGILKELFDEDKFFSQSAEYFSLFADSYEITDKLMHGDVEGALYQLFQEAEEKIPEIISGGVIGPLEGKLYYNFGKAIGDNFMEHYELLFSKQSGNFLKDLTDVAWGMTVETLYDFGMETGLEIVEKGAALFGIDYSEILRDLTGKDGIEGVNIMMEDFTELMFDGTVSIVQNVGSFIGDKLNDVGKAIGGILPW